MLSIKFLYLLSILLVAAILMSFNCSLSSYKIEDKRKIRMKNSKNYYDGKFHNSEKYDKPAFIEPMIKFLTEKSEMSVPKIELPVNKITKRDFNELKNNSFGFTWLGHATVLLKLNNKYYITDPVFSDRVSPVQFAGPNRFHEIPVNPVDLPDIEAVIISHDHYDHLDKDSIKKLNIKAKKFIMPLGVGANLECWGIPKDKIVELDWWEQIKFNEVTFTSTPALHFSGRSLSQNNTLWSSWVLKSNEQSIYFSGDSGMFNGFKEIGKKYGPFDLTIMAIGAYDPLWHDAHLNPEEAVDAHKDLKGNLLLPIHWGTFDLALHSWNEPIQRFYEYSKKENVKSVIPVIGQFVKYNGENYVNKWWKKENSKEVAKLLSYEKSNTNVVKKNELTRYLVQE